VPENGAPAEVGVKRGKGEKGKRNKLEAIFIPFASPTFYLLRHAIESEAASHLLLK
jgi:hypothetical protein